MSSMSNFGMTYSSKGVVRHKRKVRRPQPSWAQWGRREVRFYPLSYGPAAEFCQIRLCRCGNLGVEMGGVQLRATIARPTSEAMVANRASSGRAKASVRVTMMRPASR